MIIPIDEKTGLFKYIREEFFGSGLDSWKKAPAQDEKMFSALTNVFPGFDIMRRRPGYQLWNSPGFVSRRIAVYQSDANLARHIVFTSPSGIVAYNEDGTAHCNNIFTPSGTNEPRMVNSRDYAYFVTGIESDLLKWDGTVNFVLMSEDFTDSIWNKGTINVVANAITDPNGGTSANKLTGASGSTNAVLYQDIPLGRLPKVAGQPITFSVWLKTVPVSNGRLVELAITPTSNDNAIPAPGGGSAAKAVTVTTEWQRFSVSGIAPTETALRFFIGGGGFGLAAQIASGDELHAWGAQVEYGTAPTDYNEVLTSTAPPPVTGWGIHPPETAVGVGQPIASGKVTLQKGRKYYCVFRNSTTAHCSDLSPVSATTGPITNQNVPLADIPTSTDIQCDRKLILATADGGDEETLYFVADIPNADTTLIDDTDETTLLLRNIFYELDDVAMEHGVVGNQPPPNASLPTKHRGRLWLIDGQFLRFSKSLDECMTSTGAITGRYEECWPVDNVIDISEGAETPRALLTDGTYLYVGTEREIRRVAGDSILNFSRPEMVFDNAGVLNQEVCQRVFLEGNPVGAIWLSPDFRCIQSDFQTYIDIGAPIQDILKRINPNHALKSCAAQVSDGEYDLYMLAVPLDQATEPNTILVYNLRTKTWAQWTPSDNVSALLFNTTADGLPQLLFASSSPANVWSFDRQLSQDRVGVGPVNFNCVISTTWLSFEEPTERKCLNEIEVTTGDPDLQVTVEAASTQAQFVTPVPVVDSAPLVTSPFGTYKVSLAMTVTRERRYRITFTSTGNAFEVLNGYMVEYALLNAL